MMASLSKRSMLDADDGVSSASAVRGPDQGFHLGQSDAAASIARRGRALF
jgi:hypothetical protein